MSLYSLFNNIAYLGTGTTTKLNSIYTTNTNNNLYNAVKKIVELVGGVGGLLFTLAILIITLFIIFGSISAAKMRTVWISLISCCCGAFVFYAAYYLSDTIAGIAAK